MASNVVMGCGVDALNINQVNFVFQVKVNFIVHGKTHHLPLAAPIAVFALLFWAERMSRFVCSNATAPGPPLAFRPGAVVRRKPVLFPPPVRPPGTFSTPPALRYTSANLLSPKPTGGHPRRSTSGCGTEALSLPTHRRGTMPAHGRPPSVWTSSA
eukprot:338779-Chlamydomonas_euryale.AAC.4